MKRIQILLPEELLVRVDDVAGDGRRSEFIREACEARLQGSSVVERTTDNRDVAGSIPAPATKPVPAAKAGRSSMPPETNAQRYREKIRPLIEGQWKTPRQISEATGLHERIVIKMLEGMTVDWQRGAVRLR